MSASFFAKAIPCSGKWLWLPALIALIGPPNSVMAETVAGAGKLEQASHAAKPGASEKAFKKPVKEDETLPALSRAGAGRMIRVVATGYTAGVESTGKRPGHPQYGITYSGVKVRRGRLSTIAADPKLFPIGTILYIPGYGYGVVADTGSRIKGRKIDLYFPSRKQVFREWGKRSVEVRVIRRGSGKLTESMLVSIGKLLVDSDGQSASG